MTDGEMRRTAWTDPLTSGISGFGRSEQIGLFSQVGPQRSMLPALAGAVAVQRNLALEEAVFAREWATRQVKPTLPSPS